MKAAGFIATFAWVASSAWAQDSAPKIGLFDSHADVGQVLHKGSVVHDAAKGTYTITGSGDNMWAAADQFQFVWKKVSGDVALAADVSFPETGGDPHKKAVLIVRQSLDPDSAYASVAIHGNGLTSLQSREEKASATHEIQSNVTGPNRVRIQKSGPYFYMYVSGSGESERDVRFSGGSVRVNLEDPFYVGIGVSAHDKDATEKAVFAKVDLVSGAPRGARPPSLYSTLETVDVASTDRRVVRTFAGRFEAPNWSRDGASILFNGNGRLQKIAVEGGAVELIDTDFANRLTSGHGVSPDGTQLAISDQSQEQRQSIIYTVPIEGGVATRITKESPSSWRGWSPDGATLVFLGDRRGNSGIYTIPAAGGAETRLTTPDGVVDGPEYSPDGKYIYFNSDHSGTMQIWRMHPDGTAPEQVTSDDRNNWFPHIAPDGASLVFLTYEKDVTGHPENRDVSLRVMTLGDQHITTLAKLLGGQGTIDSPSWSPDSKTIAFVSYHLVP